MDLIEFEDPISKQWLQLIESGSNTVSLQVRCIEMKIVVFLKEGKVSAVYAPNIDTEIVVLDESEWNKNGLIYLERDTLLEEHTAGLVMHLVGKNERYDPTDKSN